MTPRDPLPEFRAAGRTLSPVRQAAEAMLLAPGFAECLAAAAGGLLATHAEIPREVRYVADLQKWLLSQAMLALHFGHAADPASEPLGPGALHRMLHGLVSRNTATACLHGMRHYGLVRPLPHPDGRRNAMAATDLAVALIGRWAGVHLRALDLIDGGARAPRLAQEPAMIARLQPAMLRLLLAEDGWLRPPAGVALFTMAQSGSNVLHHILARAGWEGTGEGFDLGPVTAREIAQGYLISQTHIARLLAAAEAAGLLVWDRPGRRGNCRAAAGFVADYRRWQALKFAALSIAWEDAARPDGRAARDHSTTSV